MNYTLLVLQMFNIFLVIVWFILVFKAFGRLRHYKFDSIVHVLWVAIIVFAPILGALAFLMIKPGTPRDAEKAVTPSSYDVQ